MNLQSLLSQVELGEDSAWQFKADMRNAELLGSEMAAFANAKGGTIFIGTAGDGSTPGLSPISPVASATLPSLAARSHSTPLSLFLFLWLIANIAPMFASEAKKTMTARVRGDWHLSCPASPRDLWWATAFHTMTTGTNRMSNTRLYREVGSKRTTAWSQMQRVHEGLVRGFDKSLPGPAEASETAAGGKRKEAWQ